MRNCLLSIILLFTFFQTHSQVDSHGDPDVWLFVINQFHLSEKWLVGNEMHLRQTQWFSDNEQILIRPFTQYSPSSNISYSFGYTYIRTYPYGEFPLPSAVPEHNLWEQITLNHRNQKNLISHRYRFEHRFIGQLTQNSSNEYDVSGFDFSNRFRYRITWRRDLDDKFFLHFFDEVWIRTDKKFKSLNYDRNWLSFGIGKRLSTNSNFQIAFMHQHIRNNEIRIEVHPTLLITYQYDIL